MLTTVMRISQIRNASLGPRAEAKRSFYNSNGIMINVLPAGTNEGVTSTVVGNYSKLSTVQNSFFLAEGVITVDASEHPFDVVINRSIELHVNQAFASVGAKVLPKFTLEVNNA